MKLGKKQFFEKPEHANVDIKVVKNSGSETLVVKSHGMVIEAKHGVDLA